MKNQISKKKSKAQKQADVAIIMGSRSDLKVMQAAAEILTQFEVSYHLEVVSAHRTPEKMFDFARSAASQGFQVIIAGAGGAAHLPGMVASLTTLPVIGVPVNVTAFQGLDSLLSIVQMPKGVPVACVAVDNAVNAALLAVRILSLQNPELVKALKAYVREQAQRAC